MKLFSPSCSLTVGFEQKIKMETEYDGTFISFKSQLYSEQGGSILLLFGLWCLALYLYVWVKSKFYR